MSCIKRFIKDKEIVEGDNVTFTRSPKDDTLTMTIADAMPELTGEVKAVAKNVAGQADCTAKLEVRGRPPKFIETPQKCTIMEGN